MKTRSHINSFRKAYVLAGVVTVVFAIQAFTVLDALAIAQLIAFLTVFIPFILKGGFSQNTRIASGISLLNLMVYYWYVFSIFRAMKQLDSLEGSNGEGAPGAAILFAYATGFLVLVPWGLASFRGLRYFTAIDKTDQVADGTPTDADQLPHSHTSTTRLP